MACASPGKTQCIIDLCKKILEQEVISLREVASIMGNFTWAIPTIPFAQTHYCSMQRFYITQAQQVGFNLSVKCKLAQEAKADLLWWIENLSLMGDKKFFPKNPDMEIYSDASLSWWGALCNGVTKNGSWTLSDNRHIN